MHPLIKNHVHGEKQYGKDYSGKLVINIYFKPTETDKGCWVHQNVYDELCFRRGIAK